MLTRRNIILVSLMMVIIALFAFIIVLSSAGDDENVVTPSAEPTIDVSNSHTDPIPTTFSPQTPDGQSTDPIITPTPTIAPTAVPTPTPTVAPTAKPTPNQKPVGSTSSHPDYEGKKIVSLTFDDGPSVYYTPDLLDILKERGVRVTFFIVGYQLTYTKAPSILKRAYEEGHEIGNHTESHENLKKIPLEQALQEINKLNDRIEKIIGVRPTVLRPPYGSYSTEVRENCGMPIIKWNVDSRDWDIVHKSSIKKYAEANNISQDEAKAILINKLLFEGYTGDDGTKYPSVVSCLEHGAIILFHDIHEATVDAIPILLDYLEANNYVCLPVSEMIMTEGPAPGAGEVYRSIRSQ